MNQNHANNLGFKAKQSEHVLGKGNTSTNAMNFREFFGESMFAFSYEQYTSQHPLACRGTVSKPRDHTWHCT